MPKTRGFRRQPNIEIPTEVGIFSASGSRLEQRIGAVPPHRAAFESVSGALPKSRYVAAASGIKQHRIKASLPTLKRWSVQYDWRRSVAEHDRATLEESTAKAIDSQAWVTETHFKLIDLAKRRYDWLLDPNNPNLTPAQRTRVTRVTVCDYVRLLKIENELYKRLERFEATRSSDPDEPAASYTPQELEAMMRALAEVRHGLPRIRQDRAIQRSPKGQTQTKSCTS